MSGTNPTAPWLLTNYLTQTGTAYPLAIDANFDVAQRIVDSFSPHAQTSPNMTVAVDAGHLFNGTTLTEVSAQNTGAITAPVTNPRIDRIVIDRATGVISLVAGTENASPTAPAIPAGKVPCARVLLQTSSATITNSMITDERDLAALGRGTAGDVATGSTNGTVPVFDATGGLPGLTNLEASVQLSGVISPTSLSADQNNYNPTSLASAATLRLTSSTAVNITGLQGGGAGRLLALINIGANNIVLKANSGSSSAANQFGFAADLTIGASQCAVLEYDAVASLWRLLAGPVTSGGMHNVALLTSGTSWAVPAGVDWVKALLVGGGAGGGGSAASSTSDGGGSGAVTLGMYKVTGLGTVPYAIGAAGAAGAAGSGASPGDGGNGGNTTFGTSPQLVANGGTGGSSGGAKSQGGTAAILTATVNAAVISALAGTPGGLASSTVNNGGSAPGQGVGGASTGVGGTVAGRAGTIYGGAGSGSTNTGTNQAGGAGAPGVIVLFW